MLSAYHVAKQKKENAAVYRQHPFCCCGCESGRGLLLAVIETSKALSRVVRRSRRWECNFCVAASNIEIGPSCHLWQEGPLFPSCEGRNTEESKCMSLLLRHLQITKRRGRTNRLPLYLENIERDIVSRPKKGSVSFFPCCSPTMKTTGKM